MPSPEEQELGLSKGELGLGFSQGELGLWQGLRQGEDPEDHHNRHVTGLLPHLARFRSRQRGLGPQPHPHPARSACLRGPRPP